MSPRSSGNWAENRSQRMAIDFYLDFISSFGYLARHRLVGIARAHGEAIRYHPVAIFKLRELAGSTGPSNGQIPLKLAYFTKDFQRWADLYGIRITSKLGGYQTDILNRGVYLAIERGQADAYVEAAWNAVWRDGLDPAAASTEAALEEQMGWAAGELAAFANRPDIVDRFNAETEAASARGVFGVPTFFVGDEMWWGNDRLDFLERHLDARRAG
jgi:2-hydroxychromene-2-carboxylate isomerase